MPEEEAASLADELSRLFPTVRPDCGPEYSTEQMAASIREMGVSIWRSYIWQRRKGRETDPTLRHVQAPAGLFGAPSASCSEDAVTDRITGQLELLAAAETRWREAAQRSYVQLTALRAGQLSPKRRAQVMGLLDVVYRLEQAERRAAGATDRPGTVGGLD